MVGELIFITDYSPLTTHYSPKKSFETLKKITTFAFEFKKEGTIVPSFILPINPDSYRD
jgi:hypothetical protein